MGKSFGESSASWAYRYNQRNPTLPAYLGVEHAAENWMMFKGTDTGYVFNVFFCPLYSSSLCPELMDRLLSPK